MKKTLYLSIVLLYAFSLLVLDSKLQACADLESEMRQDFVLETKRIKIPDYPYAFNPSIVKWRGGLLMCFRAGKKHEANDGNKCPTDCNEDPSEEVRDDECPPIPCPCESFGGLTNPFSILSNNDRNCECDSPNRIGLVWLDCNFKPISCVQLLNIPNHNPQYRQQDPRLIEVCGRLYIVYSDVINGLSTPETRRVFVAQLLFDGERFVVKETTCLAHFGDDGLQRKWQKNWVPFDYKGNLLLAYSINPHRILFPCLHSGICPTIACTSASIDWEWGELRGGTPALLQGDEYLAFFHSSKLMESSLSEGKKIVHYFMGAYTFSSEPPFELKKISPSPIVGENFYNGPFYKTWKPLRVVFPCGYISDCNYVWVFYGRQDHEVWVTKIDKKGLLNSLVPVHRTCS